MTGLILAEWFIGLSWMLIGACFGLSRCVRDGPRNENCRAGIIRRYSSRTALRQDQVDPAIDLMELRGYFRSFLNGQHVIRDFGGECFVASSGGARLREIGRQLSRLFHGSLQEFVAAVGLSTKMSRNFLTL